MTDFPLIDDPDPRGTVGGTWNRMGPDEYPSVAPGPNDPAGYDAYPAHPGTPWEPISGEPLTSEVMQGAYDAWAGEVIDTFYGGADAEIGEVQTINVRRVGYEYGTNNVPLTNRIAPPQSQFNQSTVKALPFPPRHDQVANHVVAGDIVTVLSGRDGKHYFFSDELPFLASVIANVGVQGEQDAPPGAPEDGQKWVVGSSPSGAWAGQAGKIATWNGSSWDFASAVGSNEDNAGGAGLLVLNIRRLEMSGTPTSGATLTDLQNVTSGFIEYQGVRVISPTGTHHGYRVGDLILVTRRGIYYYAEPCREQFPVQLVNSGPDGEDDFDNAGALPNINHYWGKEVDVNVTYAGDNRWNPAGGGITDSVRTATDPNDSGGVHGRWIDAVNLGEDLTSHQLTVDGSLNVIVSMFRDPADNLPWYAFYLSPKIVSENGGVSVSGVDHIEFDEGDEISIVVSDQGAGKARVTITGSAHPGPGDAAFNHELLDGSAHTDTVDADPVAGDIIYANATPKWDRLAGGAGNNGNVLTVTAGLPAWVAPGGGTDELVSVSADDTTPGYLNGKLVAGANITLTENNPAGNETLTIDAAGDDTVGVSSIAKSLDVWIRINGPTAKQYIDSPGDDWRGRNLHVLVSTYNGTKAAASDADWQPNGGTAIVYHTGDDYPENPDGDLELDEASVNRNTEDCELWLEEGGRLYVVSPAGDWAGIATEFQVRYTIMATVQKTFDGAPDFDITP